MPEGAGGGIGQGYVPRPHWYHQEGPMQDANLSMSHPKASMLLGSWLSVSTDLRTSCLLINTASQSPALSSSPSTILSLSCVPGAVLWAVSLQAQPHPFPGECVFSLTLLVSQILAEAIRPGSQPVWHCPGKLFLTVSSYRSLCEMGALHGEASGWVWAPRGGVSGKVRLAVLLGKQRQGRRELCKGRKEV